MDDLNFNSETGMPTIGDLVPDCARVVWEDSPHRLVELVRDGLNIRVERTPRTVEALLEQNAREAAEFNATGALDGFTKTAAIPIDQFFLWNAEGRMDDPVALARILNDSDYRKFRTNTLRV